MKMKYVILRRVPDPAPPVMAGPASSIEPSSPVAVDVDELSSSRVTEVSRMKGITSVAPVIPLQLIAPVAAKAEADDAAEGSTWGIKAVNADTSALSGNGAVVAVLDTGIDKNHPAFAGVNLVRKNFTHGSDDDEDGHGTHCAGTIFGRTVDGIRIGVAPGVRTALIAKVLGPGGGGSDLIMQAIEWSLQHGANVISMSLTFNFPTLVEEWRKSGVPGPKATSLALEGYRANVLMFESLAKAIAERSAFRQACLLVAAAGNESERDGNPPFDIAVCAPAVTSGIVSVSAVGRAPEGLTIAPFSNTGARLAGPGVGVISAQVGGGLSAMSGTSMAAPHIAGVAALWAEKLEMAGQLTARLMSDRLIGSTTMEVLKPGFEPSDVGAGLVRAPQK